ncbi:MAG TPA: glutathione peroxidase [Polyangiaceae bacterium]|jgi:glutathione peroxidase|nr:glutathione peroxidase [Polyangiaceae bacterium]
MAELLQDIPLRRIDGSPATLREFSGSVLLVVNVASKCGLTPQYEGLEALYAKYRAQGLVVLGFPANDFGAQEPGSNQEIVEFCQTRFAVDFPMFEKIAVKGEGQHPLYRELIAKRPLARSKAGSTFAAKLAEYGQSPQHPSDVLWNFEKFLVDRHGHVVDRLAPDVAPDDPELVRAIEAELAKN